MKFLYFSIIVLTVLNLIRAIEFDCESGSCETSECTIGSCVNECQSSCQSSECNRGCYSSCSDNIATCGQCNSCVSNCRSECRTSSCQRQCNDHCSNDCNRCRQGCRSSCSGNTCRQCNSCVSNCRSGCSTSSCQRSCTNQCSNDCNRCNYNEGCNKCKESTACESASSHDSDQSETKLSTNTNSSSVSNPQVDVLTNLTITNDIVVTNRIDNPISVNSTNINNISIKVQANHTGRYPKNDDDVEEFLPYKPEQNCCVVVPPKECKYEANNEVNCTNKVYKTCNNDICRSPIAVPHPIYIRVPYPVYQRVPYPVDRIQYISKPYPVSVPQYINQPVYIPIQKPVPYPVDKPVPYPVNVPQPVPVPIIKQVTIPQPYPQPVVYTKYVPQYVQQPCPTVAFAGQQVPMCRNFVESQQFLGTNQHFLMDQFVGRTTAPIAPYCMGQACSNVQLQQCGGCFQCNSGFNFNACMNSPLCSLQCRQILGGVSSLNQQIHKYLTCTTNVHGQTKCQ